MVVWRKFLGRLPKKVKALETKGLATGASSGAAGPDGAAADEEDQELAEEDLKELAGWQLNGREIKNAVRMVQSWCEHKGYSMTLGRLESGIKVTSPHASKRIEHDTSLYDDDDDGGA
jgi:hypothetical protein